MDRVELLVRKKETISDYVIPLMPVLGMVIFILFGIPLISGLFVIKFLVLIGLSYLAAFLFRRSKLEYDYCYFQGELEVDKVYNKSGRKSYLRVKVFDAELAAPCNSNRLDRYRNLKQLDISSGAPEASRYCLVTDYKGSKIRLIIQGDEKLLDAVYRTIPGKFFRD